MTILLLHSLLSVPQDLALVPQGHQPKCIRLAPTSPISSHLGLRLRHSCEGQCREGQKVRCAHWAMNSKGRNPIVSPDNAQHRDPLVRPIAYTMLSHAISNYRSTLETMRKAKQHMKTVSWQPLRSSFAYAAFVVSCRTL